MKHFGKKVKLDGYTFDSRKEAGFYERYIKNSGYRYDVHKSFRILNTFQVGGSNIRGASYAPDFVVYDEDGSIYHVYDVKTSIDVNGTDAAAKLRFKLFMLHYNHPVEVVVPRVHDFKMTILGLTDHDLLDRHVKRDRNGREKKHPSGSYQYAYYNVYKNIDYDITRIVGC